MFSTTAIPEIMETMMPANFPGQKLSQPKYKMAVERNVFITMRDGVRVACDIYRPDSNGKVPGHLRHNSIPEGFRAASCHAGISYGRINKIEWFVERGYVYVIAGPAGNRRIRRRVHIPERKEQLRFL